MAARSVFEGDKRVLICLYTLSGLTKRVVDIVQPRIHADLYEIKGEIDYSGFSGIIKSLWRSVREIPENVVSELPDLTNYDVFIIACPVWHYKAPPAVAAFMKACDFSGKPVIALSTCRSNAREFLDDFEKLVNNGTFIAKAGFYDVKNQTDEALGQKVTQWLQDL